MARLPDEMVERIKREISVQRLADLSLDKEALQSVIRKNGWSS
jgi:hypothetical protein